MISYLASFSVPIVTAITIFPFIVLLMTTPFLVWNYRKYNGLSVMRATVIFSFVFYMMCAFFLTLLPLPTIQEVLLRKPVHFNYHLFNNIQATMANAGFVTTDTATWMNVANWKKMLTSSMLFQIIANIVMQVPLGFYLKYYFRVSWKKMVVIGFLVSLFYEMTQLTGVWWIYPHAFRCPDIDDLMNNTLGCMIGFWLAPILMHFLPSVEDMDAISEKRGSKLEIIRTFTAFSVDWVVCVAIILGTNYIGANYMSDLVHSDIYVLSIIKVVLLFVYFTILPRYWNKQTIGNALVKVKIVSDKEKQEKPSFKELLYRNIVLYFFEPMVFIISLVLILNTAYSYIRIESSNMDRAIFTTACVIYFPILFAVLINSIFKHGGLPHNVWTKTHLELDK